MTGLKPQTETESEVKMTDLFPDVKQDWPLPTPEDWNAYDTLKERIRNIYPQPEAEQRVDELIELVKL